ncbi:MAG: dihydrofolate reductase, partial [Tidjanibacter sp.]|nr:dihydrofolate reductase [Tidjanibacter sp.]
MTISLSMLSSCQQKATVDEAQTEPAAWIIDRFDDIKVLRYEVPGFEELPLQQKELIYYLSEATKCGRDILFDQNFKYNLTVRRALETIYTKYD